MPLGPLPAPILLAWIGIASVPAQEVPPADEPLAASVVETVEVVADTPFVEDISAFVTHLEAKELRTRGLDLGGLLRRVPGARVRDYGGFSRFATVSLRGSTAEQVVVMVDGIAQNRALGGPVDLSFLPADQIETVSVFRGFAPASLGLGGIGGLVDVRTGAPGDGPQGQVDLLAGDLGTLKLSTGWSIPAGENGAVQLGAGWMASQGDFLYRDTRATLFDPTDDVERARENNDLRDTSLFVRGGWEKIGEGEIRFGARYQDRRSGVPGLDSFPSEEARLDEELSSAHVTWARRRTGRLRELEITADGFAQSVSFRDLDGDLGVGVQDQTTTLRGGGLASTFRVPVARHGILLRTDLRTEDASVVDDAIQVSDRGGARRDLLAVTVEDAITLGRTIIAPAIRWQARQDRFRAGGDGTLPPPAEDVRESRWSGKLGVALRLGMRCSLRGSAGTFFRVPSLLELFGDRGSVVGNPELRPEEGTSVEGGGSCEGEAGELSWSFEALAFARETRDLILLVPNSQGTAVARNLGVAQVLGLEGMLGLRWRGWSLDASGTLQRSEDLSEGFTRGHPLVGIPDRLGYVGASWSPDHFGARWDISYVGANSTDVLNTADLRLPARVIHDLGVWWDVGAGVRVGADVNNVFDRETRDVARFPLPGRLLYLHVGWRGGA